eukprot:1187869-Pleurochrysis_carterae.AAC.1
MLPLKICEKRCQLFPPYLSGAKLHACHHQTSLWRTPQNGAYEAQATIKIPNAVNLGALNDV